MSTERKSLIRYFPAVLALLLALGSSTVFSACGLKEDGTWMRCHSVQTTVTVLASVAAALLVLQALLSQKTFRIILNCAAVLVCVVIFLIPGLLMPMCMMRSMRCYTVMQPFVRIMSALIAICSLYLLIRTWKGKAK